MALAIENEPYPLREDRDGTVRVGGTRVTLDTVVGAFNDGATAEEIAHQYPALALADIYATISYYLRHQRAVEEYLAEREAQAAVVRKENEARFPPEGIRARLMARRQSR